MPPKPYGACEILAILDSIDVDARTCIDVAKAFRYVCSMGREESLRHLVDFASPTGRLRSPLYRWLWGWSPRSYGIRNIHGVLPEQEVSGRRDVYRISD